MRRSPRMYLGFLASEASLRRSLVTALRTACESPLLGPQSRRRRASKEVTPPASSESACNARYTVAVSCATRPAQVF